ncbi:MAG: AfsR/SARP family transcriptional regulator, partial [Candidatus Aquicultor sp.]
DTLSCAADFAGEKGDIKCQIRSLLAMISVYTFANDLKKVRETADRIPVAASLLKDSWSRGVVLVAALGRAAWGDNLRQGVWLSWLADKTKLDSESRMAHLIFSCIIQYRLGNLTSARMLIEKALADPYVQENERWTGTAYAIYTVICVLDGDLEKLVEICDELLRLGQKYNVPHQLGIAHRRLALLHIWEGRLDEARKGFELSRNAFIQTNNIFYAYLIDLDLILLRINAGENAGDLLPEAQYALDKLKALPGGQGLDDYALSVAGIIAMEAGQLELARQRFEEVSLRCKRKGSRQVLAGTQLFLARLSLLQGDDGAADGYLRKALDAAEAEKWEYFWDWHAETVYSLCRRALLKNIHPAWAARILRRWFPQRTREEAGSLLVYPDESVRNCIAELLQDVVQETGVPVVHINCLGDFRVFVNGVEIPPSQWKTKKAENLYKFLIADRRQHLKEKVIEELWPESDPKLGDGSLRMALTHVRKALGLNDSASESVILNRGIIYLNPEIEIYTDYELFTAIARSALEDTDTDNPAIVELLEQAIELYRGDFLPDNIYDDWSTDLRAQLHQLYLQILLKQVESYRQRGKLTPAIQACHRYLALEPADEPVSRKTMELLWQSGQKLQALSLYQELVAALAKEYSIIPSAETNNLYEKIRCS